MKETRHISNGEGQKLTDFWILSPSTSQTQLCIKAASPHTSTAGTLCRGVLPFAGHCLHVDPLFSHSHPVSQVLASPAIAQALSVHLELQQPTLGFSTSLPTLTRGQPPQTQPHWLPRSFGILALEFPDWNHPCCLSYFHVLNGGYS